MANKRGARIRTAPIDHGKVWADATVDGRMASARRISAIASGYLCLMRRKPNANAVDREQAKVAATQRFLIEMAEADAANTGSTDMAAYLALVKDHDTRLERLGLLRAPIDRQVTADCSSIAHRSSAE
jgi:hypothetical protein